MGHSGMAAMMNVVRKVEFVASLAVLLCGAAFLLKMCYLSLAFNCLFGLVYLALFYFYLRARHAIRVPTTLLVLVFAALQVDALGNYFGMYGQQFGPMQYDEFSHMTVQVLVTPVFVWLSREVLKRSGYDLSLRLTSFFAATTVFSLSAVYEIIELWDEVYFGGHRIWGPHDTASDLQWDLCGILVGSVLASFLSKANHPAGQPALKQARVFRADEISMRQGNALR
jgi:uncharacterized membrane protein YjdF